MPCKVPDLENERNESVCPRSTKGSGRALSEEMPANVITGIPFRSCSMLDYLRRWEGLCSPSHVMCGSILHSAISSIYFGKESEEFCIKVSNIELFLQFL